MKIKLIDDQHMEILRFVNDLLNNKEETEADKHEYFKDVIGRTVLYIKNHFATEERIMLATRFPGYEDHKKAHNGFTLTVIKSAKDFEDGKRLVLTNFTNFLRNWVLAHIAVMDVLYIKHFKRFNICCTMSDTGLSTEDIVNAAFEQPGSDLHLCPVCRGLYYSQQSVEDLEKEWNTVAANH
ncbi:MAG: hemerythrin family protein [Treponema sp.]|nr:hemerythrin family protein [Treponema sp.]